VVGDGLRSHDWEPYPGEVIYHDGTTPRTGFVDVAWEREVELGGSALVSGSFAGEAGTLVTLGEPGLATDSAFIDEDGSFAIRYRPNETGLRVLDLVAFAGDSALGSAGGIGISVIDPFRPAVLILEGSPTFETRHLKNWLGRRGASVAVRSAISSGRFRTEFVNRPRENIDRITGALVSRFDAVVIDGREWRGLAVGERRVLQTAPIGLLVMPVATDPGGSGLSGLPGTFEIDALGDLEERTVHPRWTGASLDSLASLPALPFAIRTGIGVLPVVRDELGTTLVAARVGSNRTEGVSLLAESYRWVLQGEADAYDQLWSRVFEVLASGNDRPQWTLAARGPVFVDEPVELVLSNGDDGGVASVTSPSGQVTPLPLFQDPIRTYRRSGSYWPREPGWHLVSQDAGEPYWFFVNDPTEFTDFQRAAARRDTRLRAELGRDSGHATPRRADVALPLWMFFAAFAVAAGYLWLEPRV
jgi:hypothetical protein